MRLLIAISCDIYAMYLGRYWTLRTKLLWHQYTLDKALMNHIHDLPLTPVVTGKI